MDRRKERTTLRRRRAQTNNCNNNTETHTNTGCGIFIDVRGESEGDRVNVDQRGSRMHEWEEECITTAICTRTVTRCSGARVQKLIRVGGNPADYSCVLLY